jgi:hypothetical protein
MYRRPPKFVDAAHEAPRSKLKNRSLRRDRAEVTGSHTASGPTAPYIGQQGAARVPNLTDPFAALLVVLAMLQVKHVVCDHPLQSRYQLQNKGTYGHPGGILHAACTPCARPRSFWW